MRPTPARSGAVTLLRVRSVPIRAHWTLLLILPYLVLVFSTHFEEVARVSGIRPGATTIPAWIYGLLVAVGLFVSIAVHELAHTFVAIRSGGRVRAITLMMLGGISQVERLPKRPRNEALMAAAGPLTSFAIGLVLLGIERLVSWPGARIAIFYLARLNLILGVFNLMPAFPMDGGRILRALLAGRMGIVRATRIAATVGKVAAVAFFVIGAIGGSVMLMLIALFLFTGADFELHAHEMREALRHLRVRDLMVTPAPAINIDETVDEALDRMRRASRMDLLVLDHGTRGIIRASDLRGIDPSVRLRELVATLAPCGIAFADENAGDALERASYLVVVETSSADRMGAVGLVGPGEVEHAFALRALAESGGRTSRQHQPA